MTGVRLTRRGEIVLAVAASLSGIAACAIGLLLLVAWFS